MDQFAVALERIERQLYALTEKFDPQLPLTLRREHAARLLDVSPSTVKGMIRRGEIISTRVSGRQMVPTSEVLRLASPKTPPPAHLPTSRASARSAGRTEAEKIRAAVRPPRKKR